MLDIQNNRVFAATLLEKCYVIHKDDVDLADALIAAYAESGKADDYDIASTIVDCIADLGLPRRQQERGRRTHLRRGRRDRSQRRPRGPDHPGARGRIPSRETGL